MLSRKYKRRRGKKKEPMTEQSKVQILLVTIPVVGRIVEKFIEAIFAK